MSPALAGVLAAAGLATLDAVLPVGAPAPGWRRLLRAAPAGALAIASRAADAPALLGLSLFLLALADAVDLRRGAEFEPAELATRCVGLLATAGFLFEMGGKSPSAAGWTAGAGVLLAGGALILRRPGLRQGPVGVLATLPGLAAAAVALAAAGAPPHLAWTAGGGALLVLATGVALTFRPGPITRSERALRAAAALALAWPFLRPA